MSEWCQNKRCPEKKNQNQIRGSKGAKYYQSNKASGYGNGNFCTLGCQTEWDNERQERVEVTPAGYYLINKLKGIRQAIPRQQAQTPEQRAEEYGYWGTINDDQAKELAITLGLAS